MPRYEQGEALQDYADLTARFKVLYGNKIFISRTASGRYQSVNALGRNVFVSRGDAERILAYNQLVAGIDADGILEDRPQPDHLAPTPTWYPDLIGPPWPGADARGPRTKWAEYDPELRRVTIEFRNGDIYRYLDVPPQIWETLKIQASTGHYINNVLNEYPYQKIRSGR